MFRCGPMYLSFFLLAFISELQSGRVRALPKNFTLQEEAFIPSLMGWQLQLTGCQPLLSLAWPGSYPF